MIPQHLQVLYCLLESIINTLFSTIFTDSSNMCWKSRKCYLIFAYWVILHAFLSFADFFQNLLFRKIISSIQSECQTVWIQTFWRVQTVYKDDESSRHKVRVYVILEAKQEQMPNSSWKEQLNHIPDSPIQEIFLPN